MVVNFDATLISLNVLWMSLRLFYYKRRLRTWRMILIMKMMMFSYLQITVKQSSIRSLTVSSSGLPHLCVSLGHIGYEAEALLDTGASDVFIAKDLVDILRQEGEDLVICNCDIGVNMVNGTNCAVLGKIYDVPVTITTELVRHVDCYVLDKPRYEFILPKKVLNGCIWVMSSENGSNDILLSGPSAQYISNVYDYFADDKVDCIEGLVGTINNDNVIPERLEVDIPWKSDARPSPNYKSALSRSRRLIARLLKDKQSYEAYESAVNELLSANVVEVCNGEDPSTFATYYMNVVPVINHSRTSTKCRLCLDARFINGYMFNCPPDDSTDSVNLWRTLIKWRSFYRVSAEDLRKAFWQVCVGERDQRFLGLLLPLKDRVLAVKWVRVPFGTRFSGVSCLVHRKPVHFHFVHHPYTEYSYTPRSRTSSIRTPSIRTHKTRTPNTRTQKIRTHKTSTQKTHTPNTRTLSVRTQGELVHSAVVQLASGT